MIFTFIYYEVHLESVFNFKDSGANMGFNISTLILTYVANSPEGS